MTFIEGAAPGALRRQIALQSLNPAGGRGGIRLGFADPVPRANAEESKADLALICDTDMGHAG